MDSNTIVWIVLLVLMILPLYWLFQSGSKTRKKLTATLVQLAKGKNSTLTKQDYCDKTIIGFCDQNQFLFYAESTQKGIVTKIVDLNQMKSCKIVTTDKDAIAANGKPTRVIDRLELSLAYINPETPNELLEFYNTANGSFALSGELQLIEKWEHLVNETIKKTVNANNK